MAKTVVPFDQSDEAAHLRAHLAPEEIEDLTQLSAQPNVIGHVVFGSDAGVIHAKNIDEAQVAAFANVFDICEALTEEIGQKSHASTLLESRKMEINCRRYGSAFAVVMQAKGPRKVGG